MPPKVGGRFFNSYTYKVEFFLSEDIPPGVDWRSWINEHIAASNQLWVMYTDPAGKWDWPLYEAGIFTGLNQAEADQTKLLCFYRDPRDKPDALANYEGVQLRADELRVFLISFFWR